MLFCLRKYCATYTFSEKNSSKTSPRFNNLSHERLNREITYPKTNSCHVSDTPSQFYQKLYHQINSESQIIAPAIPSEDQTPTKLTSTADNFLSRYQKIYQDKIYEILKAVMEVNSSDFRDPTYLTHAQHDRNVNFSSLQVPAEYQNLVETQAEVEGEVLNLADFHTPGGSSGRVKSKIKENLENLVSLDLPSSNPNAPAIQPHILKDEKILKNLQFLLHLFNYNLKQVCQTIAELYVDTAFNPAIRSQADYLEGKSLFYSKMTEFYNLQKFINKILTQNYQKTWNQINRKHENFDKILTDKLFPYYQQHHLNKIINQPRSQTLEQNDYMFFAYYNEKYLDQAGLLHGNLKSMIGALATIFDNHFENFCVTHHESELADEYQTLIAPLLNREITDMQVYFILKKLEKMEDDKFFDLIKGNEMAIEKIRGIKYGKFYLAEDAPMRVPPLVRVGNNLGGYIFKTPYNRHYYDNIERIKMDKEFDDLKLDSYKGISNCEAKELRGWGKCFIMRKKLERTSNVASKRRQKGTRKA